MLIEVDEIVLERAARLESRIQAVEELGDADAEQLADRGDVGIAPDRGADLSMKLVFVHVFRAGAKRAPNRARRSRSDRVTEDPGRRLVVWAATEEEIDSRDDGTPLVTEALMSNMSPLQPMTPRDLAFAWDPRGGFSGDRAYRRFTSPEAASFRDKTCSRSPNALSVPNDGRLTLMIDSFKGRGDGAHLSGGTVQLVDFGALQQKLGTRALPQGSELAAALKQHPECILATVPVTRSGAIELSGLPKGAQVGVVASRDPGEPPYMARVATANDIDACRNAERSERNTRPRIDLGEDFFERRTRYGVAPIAHGEMSSR